MTLAGQSVLWHGTTAPVPAQLLERARQQIEQLVRERLVGRKIDAIGLVDELLAIAAQVGEVRCTRAANRGLCFELSGGQPFEVAVDANKGKLRMMCARLAVLCHEHGHDLPLYVYGGEGALPHAPKAASGDGAGPSAPPSVTLKVRWTNTPDQQEFTLSVMR